MCLFKLLAALFQGLTRPGSARRPIALESSVLSRLHPEIIIHIARFLSTASAASFALCCYSIFDILGTRYWEALQTEIQQRERETFLSLLERDLPGYILCYHCTILHSGNKTRYETRIQPSTQPRHRYGVTPCRKEELLGGVFKYVHKDFSFSIFQMTMKRYRLGLDYSYNLSLLACKTTGRRSIEGFPYQCTAQARIITGSLFLRVQQVLLIPSGRALKSLASCRITICPHVGTVAKDCEAQLPENVQCQIAHQHNLNQCIRYSGLKQCNYCPTEYQIDLQECRQLGVAVVITKWLDLGEGRTFMDSKWWSRLSTRYTSHHIFAGAAEIYKKRLRDRVPVPFEAGSIDASFEQNEHLAFDPIQTPERVNELSKMLN